MRASRPSKCVLPAFAYVGCFTVNPGGRKTGNGHGISVFRIDGDTGAWNLIQVCRGLPHPGYLAIDRNATFLYSAHGDCPAVSAYSIDRQTGELTFMNQQPSAGHNGHHLALDPTGQFAILDKGGGVAVFPINADGTLAPFCENLEPQYDSPRGNDIVRCTHQIAFDPDGRYVIVPERNLDKVLVYEFDSSSGKLTPNNPPYAVSRNWAGPRHIAFHSTRALAYVVNETDSTVTAYHWNAQRGELTSFQVIATTPETPAAENLASEIAVSATGRFVYVSNRGHDSIVAYSIDEAAGTLTPEYWESSRGRTPRFFTFDYARRQMIVANEDSDSIVFFDVDDRSGKLTATGQEVRTGTPTCVVLAGR